MKAIRILLLMFMAFVVLLMAGWPGLHHSKRRFSSHLHYYTAQRQHESGPSAETQRALETARQELEEAKRLDRRDIMFFEAVMLGILGVSVYGFILAGNGVQKISLAQSLLSRMRTLSYQDAVELLGYIESPRHPLEILGYEHSTEGRQQFEAEQPDIEPSLSDAIYNDLRRGGVFPRQYRFRRPECGVFIERRGHGFVLIDRDKPSVESRWVYDSVEAAARALVRRRCDHTFLLHPEEIDEFVSFEHT